MTESTPFHLTPEELDAWLDGSLPQDRTSHIETCSECHELAEETRDVVLRLATLPRLEPNSRLADRVVASLSPHLTPDDLDQWVTGDLSAARRAHLHACSACQVLANAERELVLRLEALPLFDPAPAFADHVMARVAMPLRSWSWRTLRAKALSSRRSMAIAASVAGVLLGSMGASVAWSLSHRETMAAMGTWLTAQAGEWFWVGLRGAASNLMEQPWYHDVRAFLTPGRAFGLSTAVSLLYAGGLLALRRLMTPPVPRPVEP